ALPLPQRMVHQALMLTDNVTAFGFNYTGLGGQVLLEEVTETALADKTDTGGVFFGGGYQPLLFSDAPHFGLLQLTHRKQRLCNFVAAHGVQKVALVFVRIQTFQQQRLAILIAATYVVTGGNRIGAQHSGVFEIGFEFDFAVAQNIRIGRTSGFVFGQKVFKDVIPVFGGKVSLMQFNAELVADLLSIGQIFLGGAVFRAVVFVPVLHKQAFDLIALLH